MKPDCLNSVLDLPPAQILRMRAASGVTILCESGILWVTQEGSPRDEFLSAGESLCLVGAGLVLVEAMGDAAARLTLCPRDASGRAFGAFHVRAAF